MTLGPSQILYSTHDVRNPVLTIIVLNQRQLVLGLLNKLFHLSATNDLFDSLDLRVIRRPQSYIFILLHDVSSVFGKRLDVLSVFRIRGDLLKHDEMTETPSTCIFSRVLS